MNNQPRQFQRYAIYYMPRGQLGEFGATWLGWDPHLGQKRQFHYSISNIELHKKRVKTPQKYGFHATLKAPFRLKDTGTFDELLLKFENFCAQEPASTSKSLKIQTLGNFLALVPENVPMSHSRLARNCTKHFDGFRAPLNAQELAKRRKKSLSPNQEQMLKMWGYPYVLDEFRFHMTLTSDLPSKDQNALQKYLETRLFDLLKGAFSIDEIALAGEDQSGKFHVISYKKLAG